jgi:formylglycine-generating enzyme required for sulfatase activity
MKKFLLGLRAFTKDHHAATSPSITIGNMEFIFIPAGKFVMGSRDDNPLALDYEKPQHIVELADYFIGRTPVTKGQFDEFARADIYRSVVWTKNWFDNLDHPMVNVTWDDAMAFCHWYNDQHKAELPADMTLTLPTEAEWEKAARGESGREYPWGEKFDPTRCNTREGGKGDTTPVGAYSPQGDSPYGAVDVAGNVWEWCHSLFEPYPYQVPDGREDEIQQDISCLRGGGWGDDQEHARCAFRLRYRARVFQQSIGFRCVLSPRS